jgi:hypothetical protein
VVLSFKNQRDTLPYFTLACGMVERMGASIYRMGEQECFIVQCYAVCFNKAPKSRISIAVPPLLLLLLLSSSSSLSLLL